MKIEDKDNFDVYKHKYTEKDKNKFLNYLKSITVGEMAELIRYVHVFKY